MVSASSSAVRPVAPKCADTDDRIQKSVTPSTTKLFDPTNKLCAMWYPRAACSGKSVLESPVGSLVTVVPTVSPMLTVLTASSLSVGTMNGECVV